MISIDIPLIQLPKEESNSLNLSGQNKKRLAVILLKDDYEESENTTKLTAIINAVKYDIAADIHLVLLDNKSDILLANRLPLDPYGKIICFGRSPKSLGLNMPAKAFYWFNLDRQAYLFLPSLTKTMADKEKKVKLWNLIKDIL